MNEEKRQRIGNTQGALMIAVAVAIDFVQGLLTAGFVGIAVSSFISIFAWLSIYFWLKLNSVGFMDGKVALKAITLWGGAFIEMIPVINVLPAWTASVTILFLIVKAEDALYNRTGKSVSLRRGLRKMT